jgi:hypothetical protein
MTQALEPRTRPEAEDDIDERAYRDAKERAEALQGFYIHLLVYVVINTALFAINAVTHSQGSSWWFYWPLLGWGVGVLIHGLSVFANVFSTGWRDRKAMQLYERGRLHHT